MTSSCNHRGKLENQKKERKKEKSSFYDQFIILKTTHASFHWGIIHAIGSPEGIIVLTYAEQHLDVFLRYDVRTHFSSLTVHFSASVS